MTLTTTKYVIDLTEAIRDITTNVIHDSRFNQLPSDIFEPVIFQAFNDLADDFALNPEKYLQPKHRFQIDAIAIRCLDQDLDKSDLHFYFGEHN